MKVLITGDRNWDDYDAVYTAFSTLPSDTVIIHGACRGADTVCAEVAKQLGFVVRTYPAQWSKYGRAAGPIRNAKMLTEEHLEHEPIDQCFAFHDDIKNSRGTKDMLKQASTKGIAYKLFTSSRLG